MTAKLTESELLVMKCIWEAGEAISSLEIQKKLEEVFEKEWKRTTISTFLLHLTEKGYVTSEKRGWTVYYLPLVSREQYLQERTRGFLDFWYDGKVGNLVSFLSGNDLLDPEEVERLKRCIDEMDG